MLAPLGNASPGQPLRWQVSGVQPQVLGEVLRDEINLAVWQRPLPTPVAAFAAQLLARHGLLAWSGVLDIQDESAEPDLGDLLAGYAALPGQAAFLADVRWLVSAFACLLGARSVGLRLRVLDQAMCPRFHVDQVAVRLITSYAGVGSEWLREGAMARGRLGDPAAEPRDSALIECAAAGQVLLAKGEKWSGNLGGGLIHRSPQPPEGQRRVLLTLDWLA